MEIEKHTNYLKSIFLGYEAVALKNSYKVINFFSKKVSFRGRECFDEKNLKNTNRMHRRIFTGPSLKLKFLKFSFENVIAMWFYTEIIINYY